jgi:hypothetical protein
MTGVLGFGHAFAYSFFSIMIWMITCIVVDEILSSKNKEGKQ